MSSRSIAVYVGVAVAVMAIGLYMLNAQTALDLPKQSTSIRFTPPDGVFVIDAIGTIREIRGDDRNGITLWTEEGQYYKLKLVDTPRDSGTGYSEEGYANAIGFIESACPVGSTIYIDRDDDNPRPFRNGPYIGIIWCGQDPVSLNQQLLDLGHMSLPESFDGIHP